LHGTKAEAKVNLASRDRQKFTMTLGEWKDIERNYGKVLAITSVSENVEAMAKGC
jgi:hypothetical protein